MILVWAEYSARLKFQNGGDDMAATSIADKPAKLEKKIAKRQDTDKGQQISIAFAASGMSITCTAILTRYSMS
jgi:hypothetical protein